MRLNSQCVLLAGFLILSVTSLQAKARFWTKRDMIEKSSVIALVEMKEVQHLQPTRQFGDQEATFTPIRILKGQMNARGEHVFTRCFYPCAITQVKPGTWLVFLQRKKDGKLFGFNWQLSYLAITNETVKWYKGERTLSLKTTKLDTVVQEIQSICAECHVETGWRRSQLLVD